jgi:hypothetical protein
MSENLKCLKILNVREKGIGSIYVYFLFLNKLEEENHVSFGGKENKIPCWS